MNIKFLDKTCDADQETRWFDIDGVTYGLCDDGRVLDEDGQAFPNSEITKTKDALKEYLSVVPSHFVLNCNSRDDIIECVSDEDECGEYHGGSYLAYAVLDDLGDSYCESVREESLQAQAEIFEDAGAVFDREKAMNFARRILAAS